MDSAALAPGIDPKLLDQKLADLEKARAWSPRLISKLEALINSPDPWANYRVNPIQFASQKGVDEGEAVDLFLHASKLGLYKMEWRLLCPTCGDTVESFSTLNTLHSQCFCTLCRLETHAQLDDYINISFSITPQLRDSPFQHPDSLSVEDFYFKLHLGPEGRMAGGGPEMRDVLASVKCAMSFIEPGETRSFEVEASSGFFLGHDIVSGKGFFLPHFAGEAKAQQLDATLSNGGWKIQPPSLAPGKISVQVANSGSKKAAFILLIMPADYQQKHLEFLPALNGSKLLNSQTFRNLFRSETIQGSEGIGIRDLTLLFTDLKGSTEMYERIGDLQAFALVQQHFEHLSGAIQAQQGAVVKTIGDAVMASFEKPAQALAAALQMLKEIEAFNKAQGADEIILKIGIHRGTSIAVTLNERLDYFGQTVNIAARVQGIAGAEEICLTEELYRSPGVAEQLKGLNVSPEMASLKGIRNSMRIYRIAAPGAPAAKAKKKAKPKKKAKAKPKKKAKPTKKKKGSRK